jgi:hypothetical protein
VPFVGPRACHRKRASYAKQAARRFNNLRSIVDSLAGAGIATDVKEHVIYSFTGGSTGDDPFANLISDKHGNLLAQRSSAALTAASAEE